MNERAMLPLAATLSSGLLRSGMPLPISVVKYDGTPRFVVETRVLLATPALLIARGDPGRRFSTATATRCLPTTTLEYFPTGRCYNILSYFDNATGLLERHFCNVLHAAAWDGTTLHYVDLDLDLSVTPAGLMTIEDLDEFRRNARHWRYPPILRRRALAALRELCGLATSGTPPFSTDPLPDALERALAGQTPW